MRAIDGQRIRPGEYKEIKGLEYIEKIIDIDQSPIGRTPRSNPATYTGVFDDIRDLFAVQRSQNSWLSKKVVFALMLKVDVVKLVEGMGLSKLKCTFYLMFMFLAKFVIGKRYNRETLEVKYKGKNIAMF